MSGKRGRRKEGDEGTGEPCESGAVDVKRALADEVVRELIRRAESAAAQGDWSAALAVFDHLLELQPDHPYGLYGKAYVLRRLGEFDPAAQVLADGLSLHPRNRRLLSERGNLAYARRRYDQAEADYRAVLELDPQHKESRQGLADVLTSRHRTTESRRILESLQADFPEDPAIALSLGWVLLREDRLAEAEEQLCSARDGGATAYSALLGLAAVRSAQDRFAESEQLLREAIALRPDNPAAYCNLAWLLSGQPERLEEATQLCWQARKLDCGYAPAFDCLGVIAFRQGDSALAESYFEQAIELDPLDTDVKIRLALLLRHLDDLPAARRQLYRVLALDDANDRAYQARGVVFYQAGDYEAALRDFRRAAALAPQIPQPMTGTALSLARMGKLFRGLEVVRSGLLSVRAVDRWQIQLTMAQLLVQAGDTVNDAEMFEEALVQVKTVIAAGHSSKNILLLAGIAAAKAEEFTLGAEYLKKAALEDAGDHKVAHSLRVVERLAQRPQRREAVPRSVRDLLAGLVLAQLVGLWALFGMRAVGAGALAALLPIFTGLLLVVFLLPRLSQLKLPGGFEATLEKVPEVNPAEALIALQPHELPIERIADLGQTLMQLR